MNRGPALTREQAENLAIQALRFIGSDTERLGRFLAVTGICPAGIRAAPRPSAVSWSECSFMSPRTGGIFLLSRGKTLLTPPTSTEGALPSPGAHGSVMCHEFLPRLSCRHGRSGYTLFNLRLAAPGAPC